MEEKKIIPDFGEVIQLADGSYVITRNGLPYNVTDGAIHRELRNELLAYLEVNPDKLKYEAAPEPHEPTLEEQQAAFTAAIQHYLDAFARSKGYDNIFTAATYVTSKDPQFALEGQYAVEAKEAKKDE